MPSNYGTMENLIPSGTNTPWNQLLNSPQLKATQPLQAVGQNNPTVSGIFGSLASAGTPTGYQNYMQSFYNLLHPQRTFQTAPVGVQPGGQQPPATTPPPSTTPPPVTTPPPSTGGSSGTPPAGITMLDPRFGPYPPAGQNCWSNGECYVIGQEPWTLNPTAPTTGTGVTGGTGTGGTGVVPTTQPPVVAPPPSTTTPPPASTETMPPGITLVGRDGAYNIYSDGSRYQPGTEPWVGWATLSASDRQKVLYWMNLQKDYVG